MIFVTRPFSFRTFITDFSAFVSPMPLLCVASNICRIQFVLSMIVCSVVLCEVMVLLQVLRYKLVADRTTKNLISFISMGILIPS